MKKCSIIIIFLLTVCVINAQILYEISGKGLKKKSYLFGTHPAVAVSTITEVDNVFKCFNDTEAVVGEIAVDAEDMQKMMLKVAKMDKSITDLLTAEEEAMVDSALRAELNLSLSDVGHMRPAMVQNIYNMTVCERLFPRKDDDTQMDSFFQRAAIDLGKPIYGLETVDEQLKIMFHTQSLDRQARMLVNSVKKSKEMKKMIDKLNDLYLNGEIEKLYEWTVEKEGYTEADKFLLIDTRNNSWIGGIEKFMKKKSCFITVGAEHIPGKEGLVNLLKKKGYQVKPVK